MPGHDCAEFQQRYRLAAVLGLSAQATKFVVEVEQTGECPIDDGIPDDLGNHDLGIAHEGILLFIGDKPDIAKDEKELAMAGCSILNILTIQVSADQIADQAIADGNQIATRRIERVNRNRSLTDEAPALAGEDLLAAIGVVFHDAEILHLVSVLVRPPAAHCGSCCMQPGQCAIKAVHLIKGVHIRIGDDTNTGRARRQGDEPDPVARTHQMVG